MSRELVQFTQQLGLLLSSGCSLADAARVLGQNTRGRPFGEVVRGLFDKVLAGEALSEGMSHYPRAFPPVYVAMISAGESTGALVECLLRLGRWLERRQDLQRKVVSALAYPLAVAAVSLLLTLALAFFVLPSFEGLFATLGGPLPLPTRVVMMLTSLLRSPAAPIALFLVLGGLFWVRDLLRTPRLYALARQIPGLAGVLRATALARYCAVLELTNLAGVDPLTSLKLATSASGDPLLQEDLPQLVAAVRNGQAVWEHLAAHPDLYPAVMAQLTRVGEETGRRSQLFGRLARWYEEETEVALRTLLVLLEPCLLFGLSLLVGTLLLSLYLPLHGYLSRLL